MKGKESLKEQVDLIRATAESIVISNEKDLKMATDFTKEVKEKQKIIKDFKEEIEDGMKIAFLSENELMEKIKKETIEKISELIKELL